MEFPPPPVTDSMRAQARQQPGGYIYAIDPDCYPDGRVPGWAVRGGYPVNAEGEINTAGYRANPDYRPGPRALGFPKPANRLERALEIAVAGYGPESEILRELVPPDAVLHVLVENDNPDAIAIVADDRDRPVLIDYTSRNRVPQNVRARPLPMRILHGMLSTVDVRINPGTPPSATIPGRDIVQALG